MQAIIFFQASHPGRSIFILAVNSYAIARKTFFARLKTVLEGMIT